MPVKPKKFTVGHNYTIEYDDHWTALDNQRGELRGESKVVLISRGMCISDDGHTVTLEHQTIKGDGHGDPSGSHHGIVKSCITGFKDWGEERLK